MPRYTIMEGPTEYYVKSEGPFGSAEVTLTPDQYLRFRAWLQGSKLIQEALPDLSASDREILMTGIGPEQWDKMFKTDA